MVNLQLQIKDEHRPGVRSYQIVSDGYIIARNLNPSFVTLFIQMVDALNEIGMSVSSQPPFDERESNITLTISNPLYEVRK